MVSQPSSITTASGTRERGFYERVITARALLFFSTDVETKYHDDLAVMLTIRRTHERVRDNLLYKTIATIITYVYVISLKIRIIRPFWKLRGKKYTHKPTVSGKNMLVKKKEKYSIFRNLWFFILL